jgi:chorismate synthase
MSDQFGKLFQVSTFGESHGPAIGCLIDGCPPGIELNTDDFQEDLQRRATGRSRHTSQRRELDQVEILSGVFDGRTTGTALALLIRNGDQRSGDYDDIAKAFRPGHADYTYQQKYGLRDHRGGGRSSARETAARVMAATVAKKVLAIESQIQVESCLSGLGPYVPGTMNFAESRNNDLNWPDGAQLAELEAFMDGLRKSGDSIGGRVSVAVRNVPPGLGEPVYGKLDADLASALMGINAVKAVEIGDGVAVVQQRGSEHRDEMSAESAGVVFHSNHSGGILGGISTGQDLLCHVSIKPTSSIRVPGRTLDADGRARELITKGRHDPCVAIRAPVICEAMVALVLLDHILRDRAQCGRVPRAAQLK